MRVPPELLIALNQLNVAAFEPSVMGMPLLWVLVLSAFFIGVAKAGFSGVSYISVFLLAEAFGAKESIGVALPMLITGDLIVYPAYRKYGDWRSVWQFMWPALIGLAVAVYLLTVFSNESMRVAIGLVIVSMVLMQLMKKFFPENFDRLAHSKAFGISAGVSGGLATMLANAAGPIMQLFLLSRNVSKLDIIGVGARFFLIINLIKLPLNAGLDLMTWETLRWNLYMIPVVALGVWLGKKVLRKVPQKAFEVLVVTFALIAGVKLLVA
ncbi:sulfite exporter TauE/SafE family protein [Rubritalea marina]|uniref:sulfite exporter TauE/SafE family protein n=1 Tax=Rubritalea marina TaxID=361055 RepID=UPI000399CBA4|nr:sulfite exporter TauE/SafE family protein [Rubritalea marina]